MKIEVSFAALDDVLRNMGINSLVEDEHESEWEKINIILEGTGIDLVDPEQINVERNGTLSYEGRRILVYIRDQYGGEYKFHVANCRTIEGMKESGKFKTRYVASTRTDGKFVVNIVNFGEIIEKEKLIEMSVCRNCLNRLKYKGFKHQSQRGEKVFREFSLEEFFEIYGKTTVSDPGHTDRTAPVDTYSGHQSTFSRICRERAGWLCEECGISLAGEARKFLHAHHVNGNKSNNSWGNLRALCVECHDKQPGHSLPESDRKAFRKYKRKRGLIR